MPPRQRSKLSGRPPSQLGRTGRHVRRRRAISAAFRKHLPREDVVIEPAISVCPCCQGALHHLLAKTSAGCSTSHPRSSGSSGSGGRAMAAALVKVRWCRRSCATASGGRRLADHRAAGAMAGGVESIAPGICRYAPADAKCWRGTAHRSRPLHPGALDRAGGVVAEAAAHALLVEATVMSAPKRILRRHAAAGPGSHATTNPAWRGCDRYAVDDRARRSRCQRRPSSISAPRIVVGATSRQHLGYSSAGCC